MQFRYQDKFLGTGFERFLLTFGHHQPTQLAINWEEVEAIAFGQLFDLILGYPGMTTGESPIQGFVLTFTDAAILNILNELEDYQSERP